jgi:hypothetical protein
MPSVTRSMNTRIAPWSTLPSWPRAHQGPVSNPISRQRLTGQTANRADEGHSDGLPRRACARLSDPAPLCSRPLAVERGSLTVAEAPPCGERRLVQRPLLRWYDNEFIDVFCSSREQATGWPGRAHHTDSKQNKWQMLSHLSFLPNSGAYK